MPPVTNLAQRLGSRARLVYSLAALVGVVAFGTVGFKLIEAWSHLDSLYMTSGAGRVGRRIVREMRRAGAPFIAVESNALLAAELQLPDTQILIRDATLDETLVEAGIERARGLAACLPDDADNLYVVLT